jgi:hypothetical protein
MQLWQKLYSTVWLAFFSCVLIPGWMGSIAGWPVHALLGLAMLIMTWTNARRLDALPVPSRLKSIGKTAKGFAVFQIVGGLALGAVVHLVPNLAGDSCGCRSGNFGYVLFVGNGLRYVGGEGIRRIAREKKCREPAAEHMTPGSWIRVKSLVSYRDNRITMARGWESKSVEIQIEEAGSAASDVDSTPQEESVELQSKRQGLMLQRSRFLQELETARNPRYREMLNDLLKHVEQELAELANK